MHTHAHACTRMHTHAYACTRIHTHAHGLHRAFYDAYLSGDGEAEGMRTRLEARVAASQEALAREEAAAGRGVRVGRYCTSVM